MRVSAYAHVCIHVYVLMCVGMGSSAQGSVKGIAADLGLQWAWGAIGRSTYLPNALSWYDQPKKAAQGLGRCLRNLIPKTHINKLIRTHINK